MFLIKGKVYALKVYQLPIGSRAARGKPFVNLLPLEDGEKINAFYRPEIMTKTNLSSWQRQRER